LEEISAVHVTSFIVELEFSMPEALNSDIGTIPSPVT